MTKCSCVMCQSEEESVNKVFVCSCVMKKHVDGVKPQSKVKSFACLFYPTLIWEVDKRNRAVQEHKSNV